MQLQILLSQDCQPKPTLNAVLGSSQNKMCSGFYFLLAIYIYSYTNCSCRHCTSHADGTLCLKADSN